MKNMKNNGKARLIKKQEGWYNLYQGEIGIGSTNSELQGHKLSIKACKAIELGYDLDELANLYSTMTIFIKKDEIPTEKQIEDAEYISKIAFKAGFQKCLELLGDKKYSEEDMHQALHLMNNRTKVPIVGEALDIISKMLKQRDEIIQSLQQTEWDVEIEMETVFDIEYSHNGYRTEKFNKTEYKPKLDADGCLILKRI